MKYLCFIVPKRNNGGVPGNIVVEADADVIPNHAGS